MTFVIGDIHGHYDTLIDLLKNDIHVINDDLTWCGGNASIYFVGDYVNRGPDSIKVLDFLISLQIQAELNNAQVVCLQGNHEHLMLATHRFRDRYMVDTETTFLENWIWNGGKEQDIDHLTPEHIAWITHLPALAKVGKTIITHADAMLYLRYGETIEAVNQAFETILRSYDLNLWDRLLRDFNEHRTFWNEPEKVQVFLNAYGGEQVIHGHSTIGNMLDQPAETVTQALVYADERCINVDGGIYKGGKGFVYEIKKDETH